MMALGEFAPLDLTTQVRPPQSGRKVAFVISSLTLGGAERVVTSLAKHWADAGHRVTIISLARPHADFYPSDPQIQRIWLDLSGDSSGLGAAIAANWRRVKALRSTLAQLRPDVAIAFMTEANILLGLAAWRLGVRTLGSERNYPPTTPMATPWRIARRWGYGLLDGLVAQTEAAAGWIRANSNARRVTVIPNAIALPLPRSAPLAHPGLLLPAGAKMVLCVGRLCDTKRFDRAIDAFARAAPKHPDWVLVFLGDGPLRADLERQAADRGLSGRVHFPGAVGNPGDWYAAADLFLMTSAHEGYPNALLEAMAHGRACLSIDCPVGPGELINSETNGVLAPSEDALAWALERCMADPDLRRRLGEAALAVRETNAMSGVAASWEAEFGRSFQPRAAADRARAESIAFVVSGMGHGGAERVAANLCNHWAAEGRRVDLIITFSGGGPSIYPLHPNVTVHHLVDPEARPSQALLGRIQRLYRLRRLLRSLQPSRVYAFMTAVNVAVLATTRGLKTRLVISERTYPPAQRLNPLLRMARRLTYPLADVVVMQTSQGADWMAKACQGANVVAIPNPLTEDLPEAGHAVRPEEVFDASERKILLAAGRLSSEKQFGLLIDAFAEISAERPDWDLVILGEGGERAALEQRAAGHGLKGRVHLPGHAGNMTDWYRCAEAFVLTSAREGFPNALMEALACGVPAVSFDCATGPRDLIEHGVNGFLVPPAAGPQGVAAALRDLGSLSIDRRTAAAIELRRRLDIRSVASDWLRA